MDKLNRYKGAFIGLAVGDALGAQVEHCQRGTIVTELGQPGPWNLPPGGWTDDTAQAICLAQALIEKRDRNGTMNLFVEWFHEGKNSCTGKPVGIGATTLKAIQTYAVTGKIMPPTDYYSAGNGCIMRLAPVVIWCNKKDMWGIDKHQKYIDSATLTHGSEISKYCTAQFGQYVDLAFEGTTKEYILDASAGNREVEELKHIYSNDYMLKTAEGMKAYQFNGIPHEEPELKSDGYCVNTLECALWAFYHTKTFEEGMIKAIALGGDTDTIGAVYGQLAGAYYGYDAIPDRWKKNIMWHDKIVDMTEKLLA